ncbi:MAG TPA: YnbE family lipoprotein [Croceibacterium sp.]|nr:YnbE family lipoprotein [Croceibacterium sp.]
MIAANLTKPAPRAHNPRIMGKRKAIAGVMAVLGSALAAGCVTVKAPSEPIVIELNINISQEVIYRLADDVRQNIEENPEIF